MPNEKINYDDDDATCKQFVTKAVSSVPWGVLIGWFYKTFFGDYKKHQNKKHSKSTVFTITVSNIQQVASMLYILADHF